MLEEHNEITGQGYQGQTLSKEEFIEELISAGMTKEQAVDTADRLPPGIERGAAAILVENLMKAKELGNTLSERDAQNMMAGMKDAFSDPDLAKVPNMSRKQRRAMYKRKGMFKKAKLR